MRVAIAGAGLFGRLIGWRLAERGADVTLWEQSPRDAPTSAAHAAAAMLAPASEAPDADAAIFHMGKRSLALWPPMLDALGVPYGMDGSVLVAHGQDAPLLDKFLRSLGPRRVEEARPLDAHGIAALEPALAGRFERGLHLPNEGWLDNRALLSALATRCGEIRYGVPVTPANLHANLVIDCRGAGAGLPDLRGVRGEVIRLAAPEVQLSHPVRLMHPRYQLYVAPRPGRRYVVGATQIESDATGAVTVRSALELLSAAFALHPGFAEAEVLELSAGLRAAYPDNLPRVEWRDGALCVNGLYRHGFLVAPAVLAEALTAIDGREQGARPLPRAASKPAPRGATAPAEA